MRLKSGDPIKELLSVLQFSGKYRLFFLISSLLLCVSAMAQVEPLSKSAKPDSTSLKADTIVPPGNAFRDSAVVDLSKVKFSSNGLDEEVQYGAKDSMWFDVKKKQVHLYGSASVKYTALTINAGYILLDYEKSEIIAESFPDTSGQLAGLPQFKDAEQDVTATRIRYNFKSKKGIIYEARTKQEDLYVLGERAKFVGSNNVDTTKKGNTVIYNQNAILTTCDAPHPHYGIRTNKLKVIPDKLVVTGLSNLEIGGIPTPLIIPFGFFPITKTRKAGLIIPRDFEFADREGLGIKDFGWYQPISPYMDATALFNAYTSGSWGVAGTLRYNRKYRYTGNFNIRYNNRVAEDVQARKVSAKSFGVRWSHDQDTKAHPSQRFGGSVNIETNRDQNRNRNDFASVYQNTLMSNLNYAKTFPGKPYQLNVGLTHSQNTQTRIMDISLPNATFTMQRIFPFRSKEQVGKEYWYEKISLTYNSQLRNDLRTVDTLLFTRKTLESARIGVQHRASTDYNIKLFKYLNIAPSLQYEENWYPYTIEKQLGPESRLDYDTLFDDGGEIINVYVDSLHSQFGIDTTIRNWGFYSYRKYNAGISANTVLFFTKQFKRGWFRGIRHTMKPSVSMGFGPDYSKSRYDRFYRTVETDLRPAYNDTLDYGIFDDAVFGRPDNGRTTRELVLNYSLINVLEFKYFSTKRDTVYKKRIFDNLGFTGSYSPTRDTLRWSEIGTGGLFRLFKGITNISWTARFDPYIADATGRRVNQYVLREKGKLLRTTALSVAFNTNFTVGQIRDMLDRKSGAAEGKKPRSTQQSDELLSWFDDFRVTHRISFDRRLIPTGYGAARDTLLIGSNNLGFAGDIPLTSKWKININNISYDFQSKQLVYPDLGFSRDLHCWEMRLSWQPTRGTYMFTINVKPGTLDFLKIPYRQNNFDARR